MGSGTYCQVTVLFLLSCIQMFECRFSDALHKEGSSCRKLGCFSPWPIFRRWSSLADSIAELKLITGCYLYSLCTCSVLKSPSNPPCAVTSSSIDVATMCIVSCSDLVQSQVHQTICWDIRLNTALHQFQLLLLIRYRNTDRDAGPLVQSTLWHHSIVCTYCYIVWHAGPCSTTLQYHSILHSVYTCFCWQQYIHRKAYAWRYRA